MHQYRAAVVAFRGTSLFDILLVNEDYKVSASGVLERRMHDGFGATQDTEFVPPLLLKSGNEQQLHIDPYHAGCIRSVLPHSERFCKGFLAFVTQRAKRTRKCVAMRITGGLPPSKGISELEVLVPRLVIMRLERTQCDWIDHKWNHRISDQVTKRAVLEDAMAWLNTLGGGYSALGDYFEHHAREAGRISLRQFKIALEMGDPPTVIRCRLYYSLSLMQTGRLREAAQMIRWQFHFAKKLQDHDHRLVAMCKGIWSRLKFMHQQHRERTSGS